MKHGSSVDLSRVPAAVDERDTAMPPPPVEAVRYGKAQPANGAQRRTWRWIKLIPTGHEPLPRGWERGL